MERKAGQIGWRRGILFLTVLSVCLLLRVGSADAAELPERKYTPEGSDITYTFTGTENGYVANVESYRTNAVKNGELRIERTIRYVPEDGGEEKDVQVAGILHNVFEGCTSLTSLILPDTVHYIGRSAFANCTNLMTIQTYSEADDGSERVYNGSLAVREVESRAFYGCTALSGIMLGDQIRGSSGQIIQDEAFMGCSMLRSVEIGPNVTWIAGGAFADCDLLDGLNNGIKIRDNALFFVKDGILYYKESGLSNVLLCCPSGTAAGTINQFPENVTAIKNEAFYGCAGIVSVEIPNTVKKIGEKAFYECTALEEVKIPDSVTELGTQIFGKCSDRLVIICSSGSPAEKYTESNNLKKQVECTVTFYNTYTQDVVVKTVMNGQKVETPTGWERPGYVLRWSDNFDSNTIIQGDRTVSTVWKKLYSVTFRDSFTGNETIVGGIEEGGAATAPNWTRKGYKLTWSTEGYKKVTSDMVVNAVWLISWTDEPGEDEEKDYQKGSLVIIDNLVYKISDYEGRKVKLMGIEDDTESKLVIPDTVTFGGRSYRVTRINAKAFQGNSFIISVTIGKYVRVIGNRVFQNCSSMNKMTIFSKQLVEFGDYAFKNTKASLKIKVPKGLVSTYRTGMLDAGLSKKAKVVKNS